MYAVPYVYFSSFNSELLFAEENYIFYYSYLIEYCTIPTMTVLIDVSSVILITLNGTLVPTS